MLKHPLAREIAAVIILKLIALALIAYFFFSPETRAPQDPSSVATAVLKTTSPAQPQP